MTVETLIDAAMALRGAAPQEWAKFVSEIQNEAAQVNLKMVAADPALLLRAQGMAMQANETASYLANAPKIHEKFAENRMKQHVGRQHGTR